MNLDKVFFTDGEIVDEFLPWNPENEVFEKSRVGMMVKLGCKYKGWKSRICDFVSQAPFKFIFASPLLRRVFKVRRTSLFHFDLMYTCSTDAFLYRLRWLGFVNVCLDLDGSLYRFSLNRGRTVSEVKAHFRWAIQPSYERWEDWREYL